MIEEIQKTLSDIHPLLVPASGLVVLGLVAWLTDVIARRQLVQLAHRVAETTASTWDDVFVRYGALQRAAQILPAIVVYYGARLVPTLSETSVGFLQNAALAFIVLSILLALNAALSAGNAIYEQKPGAHKRPIKGYIQVTKLVLVCIGIILILSALMNRSPLLLLSGLGAVTAVLLLVFRDTILSLVASIQLSSLDMVRVGDWIEMPKYEADGDVIDVALHTIRVQNWDKTITTIPTHRLITDSFRNWRGMSESGGRRIKRSLLIDMGSVRFLTKEEEVRFKRFALLTDYIKSKQQEIADYNAALGSSDVDEVNLRRLTNLGTFRAYVYNYLKNHPKIHEGMTLLVRQTAPESEGIPVEIYCFTNTTNWGDYENIQADIFDHLLAILNEFGLRAYQHPSGADVTSLSQQSNAAVRAS